MLQKQTALARGKASYFTAIDGTRLYFQDWGTGRPIVFLSSWTFDSTVWGEHIVGLVQAGFRCIAPDRRGHGRSDAPSHGYDLDTLAGDVAALLDELDIQDAVLVCHSMGSVEALRYLECYGSARVAKLMLVAPTTPCLVRSEDNPDGVPIEMINGQLNQIGANFAQWIKDNEPPFFLPETPDEIRRWVKSMMLSIPVPIALECRRTISTADTRAIARTIDIPTIVIHGDRDASAPIAITGAKTASLIKNSRLVVYEGAPHALNFTHRERLLADIASFSAD